MDEADKMVEKGHYDELDSIIKKVINPPSSENREDDEVQDENWLRNAEKNCLGTKRQTLLFSATLAIGVTGRITSQKRKRKRGEMKMKKSIIKARQLNFKNSERVGLRGKPYVVDFTVDSSQTSSGTKNSVTMMVQSKHPVVIAIMLA